MLRRCQHSWPQTKSQSHFLSVFPSIHHVAPGESAIKTNQPSRNPEDPSGQMCPWNCWIIFAWHRKETTHNKRGTRWWQISLTLLRMKGESGIGGHWGARWACAEMPPWGSVLTFSTTWWRTHTHTYTHMHAHKYVNAIVCFNFKVWSIFTVHKCIGVSLRNHKVPWTVPWMGLTTDSCLGTESLWPECVSSA